MAKKVTGFLKLQVPAGSANPAPPIGPALGQRGLNIMQFCKDFNAQTQKLEKGAPIPVRDMAGSINKAQVKEIAQAKMKDLNCDTIEAAMRMVEGSARSMGIEVK